MKKRSSYLLTGILIISLFFNLSCSRKDTEVDYFTALQQQVEAQTKLAANIISYENIVKGKGPAGYGEMSGAPYKPSYNEDPAIPAQCWIETGYGTQNACKYCHTNYLADLKHGNAFPIGEDQILYSFPSPNLNRVNWKNLTHPQQILQRLKEENISAPQPEDEENLSYIRSDNWSKTFKKARPGKDMSWDNRSQKGEPLQLFPALDPQHLFPYKDDPTDKNTHGYIDKEGFVKDQNDQYTGWRAVNFFPYAIFTPLTGSVSGIYIRLPRAFMSLEGKIDISIYKKNLDLLEKNIKNLPVQESTYFGNARKVKMTRGFYPRGTEFAHPLHYVDLNADGQQGQAVDGVVNNQGNAYEFPGTRSKRIKEVRYMYKWKDVGIDEIGDVETEDEYLKVIGREGQGWIDNKAGWIIAAYIENREGNLRPQTTEELLQCLGCHSSVGVTIDAVWSFQRKLPGALGWQEMNYGFYQQDKPDKTHLSDFQNENIEMGELQYFYYSVVGADLFGVMPQEIKEELTLYAGQSHLQEELQLKHPLALIFDDHTLKHTKKEKRHQLLKERARIMRHYAGNFAYLAFDLESNRSFIKGNIFYPSPATMKANIAGYRRIVLDQSFNLGKGTFGATADAIPFTLRSDGTVKNSKGELIPAGEVITSRPWNKEGVGYTPTGIARVNDKGEPVDTDGKAVDIEKNPQKISGHIKTGGTFDSKYNPIIKKKLSVKKKDKV